MAEMSKMTIKMLWLSGVFFQAPNTPKFVFGRGSAPDPAWGAYDAPPEPLVGWGGGYPLPIRFPLNAFGISISAPSAPPVSGPPTQIPGYAYAEIFT